MGLTQVDPTRPAGAMVRARWPAILIAVFMSVAAVQESPGQQPSASITGPTVTLNGERLVGSYGSRHRQVASFKGIPYAAPPIGPLRWEAPRPPLAHTGTHAAQSFAAACYQDSYNTDWYRRLAKGFGTDAATFVDPDVSEDCLYLNIWTPAPGKGAKRPVLVWIHGGSNKAGWSYEPNYQGENLAARGDLVVVSIAYRLGVFGFMGHPELRGSPAPANFGLLDQLAALRWIHAHIDHFGGDPTHVTVAGESAGGADLGYLLASPLARGLFQRAISQSGGYLMDDTATVADAEATGIAVANSLPGRPSFDEMRRRPSAEIFSAAKLALAGHQYLPVVDGISVITSPAAAFRQHGITHDLLIGSNENEWYMYVDDRPESLAAALAAMPAGARDLLAARAAREPNVRRGHDKATALAQMACPAYLMAESATRRGKQSWVYRFSRIRPGPGGAAVLAYHGAEIPYVFDTHDAWLTGDAIDEGLTTTMLGYWSRFARTGNPNARGLPPWPAYVPATPEVMDLGDRIAASPAPDHDLCQQVSGALYPGWSR